MKKKTKRVRDHPIEWQIEFYTLLKNNMQLILDTDTKDLQLRERTTNMLNWCNDELKRLREVKL